MVFALSLIFTPLTTSFQVRAATSEESTTTAESQTNSSTTNQKTEKAETTSQTAENTISKATTETTVMSSEDPTLSIKSIRRSTRSFASESIKDTISTADKTKVIVVPSPIDSSQAYQEYAASETGVKAALYDLYQNGAGSDYALYIGTNLTLSAATTAKEISGVISASNIGFTSLSGKVGQLVITGDFNDPLEESTSASTNAKTVSFNTNTFFGTNVTLRNIRYSGTNFYMNGHDLNLAGGSYGTTIHNIYGGTDSGDLSGNPTIQVNSTGVGTWNFYGGNSGGGTLTGNVALVINNTTGNIGNLVGGANVGTINGNISNSIYNIAGTLTAFYGGGYGSSATQTANVTGNITNKFSLNTTTANMTLALYYGGVNYGDITGKVQNNFSGAARWSGTNPFVGGSAYGDISSAGNTVLYTNFDTSKFTSSGPSVIGANRYQGTIKGNIENYVTAGTTSALGGIRNFDGGGGDNVSRLTKAGIGASNETTYDAYSVEERASLAESAATFKIYGNITSHLISGSFGNGDLWRTTAAGIGGYIEGNVSIEVGTYDPDNAGKAGGTGLVYKGTRPTNVDYSTSNNAIANAQDFDIAAGGIVTGRDTWTIYIKGNTNTVISNAVARRTYGGMFSGVVEGNTNNTLHSGIVDTLEGAGYQGGRIYGDATATVNNGQVDWFLSGGGWDDKKIVGDANVTVYDGVINASMGASYGSSSDHTVTGNSHVHVYGGDFSGTPRTGSSGFSGGITNNGSLLGSAELILDFRNYAGEFKLPSGTSITGGRPYGSNTTLGTSATDEINLQIYTKSGVDSLNGATIYGDGGTSNTNSKIGKITIDVQATDSSIGYLYATQYSNISSNKILRDVTINLQGALSINGLSGGSANDNITNTIVANSTNKSVMNIGTDLDDTNKFQVDPINVNGIGIVNFTSLHVTNGVTLMASTGNIKNGFNATAANHSSIYNQFGDITLSDGGSIGVNSTTGFISAGKLTVKDSSKLYSYPGTGIVNISDIELSEDEDNQLTWVKLSTDENRLISSTGTNFGDLKGYQVLTINPTIANAAKITPINFKGIEETTGKTFIGDNDVTKGTSGYGIAIPGSIIEYEIENPGIAEGKGSIFHDVSAVLAENSPLTIKAWGTEVAGTKVQKGRLVVPYINGITPTLSFEPETEKTGSWLYGGEIVSSQVGSPTTTLSEQADSETVDWQSPDGQYSYQIKISYSNQAELTAKNIIVSEQEAATLANKTAILDLMEAKGRPFFTDSLTADVVNAIQQPLENNQISRKHVLNYAVGTSTSNQKEKQVNLIVVQNGATISSDRSFAVYAKDTRLKLAEANGLANQAALNLLTAAQVIFADGSESVAPTLNTATFDQIKNVQESELLKNVSTQYSYQKGDSIVTKTVNVSIAGTLELKEVPNKIDFGSQKIGTTEQEYWPTISGNLVVKDTRGSERDTWQLTVSEKQPLTSGTHQLTGSLSFLNGTTQQIIGSAAVIVETKKMNQNGEYNVNQEWGQTNNKGLKLTIPVEKQKAGSYEGTLSWSLVSAPDNS